MIQVIAICCVVVMIATKEGYNLYCRLKGLI